VHVIGSCEWGRKRREGPYLKVVYHTFGCLFFFFYLGEVERGEKNKGEEEGGREITTLLNA